MELKKKLKDYLLDLHEEVIGGGRSRWGWGSAIGLSAGFWQLMFMCFLRYFKCRLCASQVIDETITGEQLNKQAQDMQREVTTGLRADQRGLKKTFKERELSKDELTLELRRAHDKVCESVQTALWPDFPQFVG